MQNAQVLSNCSTSSIKFLTGLRPLLTSIYTYINSVKKRKKSGYFSVCVWVEQVISDFKYYHDKVEVNICCVEVGGFHQNGKRKELHHKQATQGVDYRAYYTQKWDRLFERAWV
ncbi:unnamed protein product, partial [Callosobruchus maculatus]